MGRRREKDKKRSKDLPPRGDSKKAARREQIAHRQSETLPSESRAHAKRPIIRFVLLFGLCMLVFFVCTNTALFQDRLFPAYLRLNANVSAAILAAFGERPTVVESTIMAPRFSLGIERGCDAVEPSALFLSAVLASPVSFWAKVPGMLIGTAVLMIINLVRIISLFYTGVFFPDAFHAMHADVWQVVFILLALLFWVIWARRARGRITKPDVST